MTSVQTMLRSTLALLPSRGGVCAAAALSLLAVTIAGCESADKLDAPQVIVTPYDAAQGEALWAVIPLINESGISDVDALMVSDKLVAAIDQSRGIACLPLNRTIAGMRAARLDTLRTPEDAQKLSRILGTDALVIGTITDYDPYNPPKLGLALALYAAERNGESGLSADPMRLRQAYSDNQVRVENPSASRPTATVSEHLDASNHDVLLQVKQYALGRHDKSSAMGWRQILSSMDRYTEFAAFTVVSRLVDQERIRVSLASVPPPPALSQRSQPAAQSRVSAEESTPSR